MLIILLDACSLVWGGGEGGRGGVSVLINKLSVVARCSLCNEVQFTRNLMIFIGSLLLQYCPYFATCIYSLMITKHSICTTNTISGKIVFSRALINYLRGIPL